MGSSSAMSDPRPPYFAMRVLRLATKTALAQHCGTDVLALLCVIAVTEDARRYRGPVAFWNDQLLTLLGFGKWDRLDRARKAAVKAGWLLYEPGGRHKVGLYRVVIPADLQGISDTAVDEGSTPESGYQEGERQRELQGERAGERQGEPSYLIPQPEPSPSNGDGDEWRGIEKQLRAEGVREGREAIQQAREAGCSPADIQAVIDYFRSRRDAWELPEAALYRRVLNATPDQLANDPATWFPFKPAFLRREQSAKEARQRIVEAQTKALAPKQPELTDAERQELSAKFAETIARLRAGNPRQITTQDSSLVSALKLSDDRAEFVTAGDDSPRLMHEGDARSPPAPTAPMETDAPRNEASARGSSITHQVPSKEPMT